MSSPRALREIPTIAWAIVAFCAWRSAALLDAWRHSPLDRLGWAAFACWLLPLPVLLLARPVPATETRAPGSDWLFGALLSGSLLTGLFGALGSLNSAAYLGLALAFVAVAAHAMQRTAGAAGTLPRFEFLVWAGAALTWMPVLSWLAKDLPVAALSILRLAAALGASLLLVLSLRRPPPRP